MQNAFRLSLCLLALLALAPATLAQFKKEKHPRLGIASIERPRQFDPVPVQPDESYVKLFYKERAGDPKRKSDPRRLFRPELRVVEILRGAPLTGAARKRFEEDPEVQIIDLPSYVQYELEGWSATLIGPGKSSKDYETREYRLERPSKKRTAWSGYAYAWIRGGRTVAVIGLCLESDRDEMVKLWRKTGQRLKLVAPTRETRDSIKWQRYYRSKGYSHPDYRLRVREQLVSPWKAEDTDNFIVVYNTKDQPLLRKILRDLEILRGEYMKIFPPEGEFDAVSTVRICKDKDEYSAYGGSSRSAGYWNYKTEELVLYDAQKVEKSKRPDDSDTYSVLYHEAFHQYIYYSTGQLHPHTWFNEGYGDYFGGADIRSGKIRRIGANSWRAGTIKAAVAGELPRFFPRGPAARGRDQQWVPWSEMIEMSKAEYYADGYLCYAQGWSMVYFLMASDKVRRKSEWAKILPTYFEVLKTSYPEELALRTDAFDENTREETRQKVLELAAEESRKRALEAAFQDVAIGELEAAWLEFVEAIDDPRAK